MLATKPNKATSAYEPYIGNQVVQPAQARRQTIRQPRTSQPVLAASTPQALNFSDTNFNRHCMASNQTAKQFSANNRFDLKSGWNTGSNGALGKGQTRTNHFQSMDLDPNASQKTRSNIKYNQKSQRQTDASGKVKATMVKPFPNKFDFSLFDNNQKQNKNLRVLPKTGQKASDGEPIQYTIKHFFESNNEDEQVLGQENTVFPWLGRMKLVSSLRPVKSLDKVLTTARRVPQIYMPMLFLPQAVFASEAPPGFEEFDKVFTDSQPTLDVLEYMVNINKNCILSVLQQLHEVGIHNQSAGLAIIIWAATLKLLTSPFYENALKYPTQMEKAIQSVIETELNNEDLMDDGTQKQPQP